MNKQVALRKIMYAKSIAVIGASNKVGSVGNETMKRLISYGYSGKIYPINPHDNEIEGIKAYKKIGDIQKNIDLAIIAIPSKFVADIIEECHNANVECVIVFSSGFKEIGGVGVELEKAVQEKIKKYKMNMIGPNCLGVINTATKMNATFNSVNPFRTGNVGFISQSGALASGVINLLQKKNFGFSQVISIGNQADIDFLDIIEFWENDENVKIIMLYVEAINAPQRFREVCTRVSSKKPIIMLKAGRSKRGGQATMSHTGSMAGDNSTLSALIKSSGVIREIYLRDLINTVQMFNNCAIPQGNRLAILTNAGGPGIIATDTASDYGINIAELTEKTKEKLQSVLPPQASVKNPVDVIASASLEQFKFCAETLLKAEEVDILMVIYLYITIKNDTNLAIELNRLKKLYPNKTIVAVFQTSKSFYDELVNSEIEIPIYNFGVDALSSLRRLIQQKNILQEQNYKTKVFEVDKLNAKKIIKSCEKENLKTLSTYQSLQIFSAYGIPLAKFGLAKKLPQAKKLAEKISYPVVLKISSTKISHKTDVGGVITNIKNAKELKEKWEIIIRNLTEKKIINSLEGIIVMKQVEGTAREFVAGAIKKEGVGHTEMFGIGGIFIEALKEVAFAPCPLTTRDVLTLIGSTKAKNLLGKVRDYEGADKEKLAEVLLRLSQLVGDFPQIKEVDINPIIADKQGKIISVDARIVLE